MFVECPECRKRVLKILYFFHQRRHQRQKKNTDPAPARKTEDAAPAETNDDLQIKKGISLTFAAGQAIRELIDNGRFSVNAVVRVTANKNLSSGYHYDLAIEDRALANDAQYLSERVKIIVDRSLVEILRGTVIDYESDSGQAGFRFHNPNVD